MTDPDGLTYAPRATCDLLLPALASVADPNCFLTAGNVAQCPDCGRTWTLVETVTWGSPVQVEWQCTEPPPADWPAPPVDEPPTDEPPVDQPPEETT